MDCVQLNKLRIYARHGVMPQEQKVGNLFEVTVHLQADMSAVMQSDDIADGISYAVIYEVVKDVMAVPSKTLEHVAYRLKTALTDSFPSVTGGLITIAKITPPFPARVENAAFTHTW
ncbi:MAG: dihydroneopterin aldolase [Muribaculaceae bacterium]|nr:dihydroneopterin aldolase [Muribaculaceae bacterium]